MVRIDDYRVDIGRRALMVAQHTDKPGHVGHVRGSWEYGPEHRRDDVGRESGEGSQAVMVLKLDGTVPDGILAQLRQFLARSWPARWCFKTSLFRTHVYFRLKERNH